ncbi:NCS2 family permease [Galactobacter sp.]|uniref:NCS2 family permease n=1 Tax=Galactobacter sp. TaxID=2676125 RepID=UPI0025C31DAF|nr:NCS2 family permease [Galactobacter sp.]
MKSDAPSDQQPNPTPPIEQTRVGALDRFFGVTRRGSTWSREVIAGATMFFATVYASVVVPGMLTEAGLPLPAAITCVLTLMIIATAAMGLVGNLPMVLAPGLGGVALVAYTLVGSGHVSYPVAMGMVFWSGIVFLLLTIFGVRNLVTKIIPEPIRLAISPALGLFIAFIGLRNVGLVQAGEKSLEIGDLGSSQGLLALAGIVVLIALQAKKVPGAFIIVIVVITVVGIPMGLTKMDGAPFGLPASTAGVAFDIDLWGAFRPEHLPYWFAFLASEFFAATGVVMAVTDKIKEKVPADEKINLTKPFMVDSTAIIGGSLFGAPSIATYAESTSGSESGGRTGFSSLVTAAMFVVVLFMTPLAAAIPNAATAPVVIVVGLTMLSNFRKLAGTDDLTDLLPAAMCLIGTICWGNIGTGIAAGLLSYALVKLVSGKVKQVHPGMWVLVPFLLYFFYNLAVE